MTVTLIGSGCGRDTLTAGAAEALKCADLIIGAKRLLQDLDDCRAETAAEYRPEKIIEILKEKSPRTPCVLLSGDSGFYSGAARLLSQLEAHGIDAKVIPGISSLQVLAARLGLSWQDWRLCSAHGTQCDPVREVMYGKPVFFLTSGADHPSVICRALTEAGLGQLTVTVGECLGQKTEKIRKASAADFAAGKIAPAASAEQSVQSLNVVLTERAPVWERRTPGIADQEFCRENVPMTKQEVRAVILAKLRIRPDDVCWDVGAGTGSVSVELALNSAAVWAVEQKPEAAALIRRNRAKFCAWNLRVIEGHAPEILEDLPVPDAVFIGGSGGGISSVIEAAVRKNPDVRICASAVTLETLGEALKGMEKAGLAADVVQISVSRAEKTGGYHMMKAQNPVYILTGERA